MDDVALTDGDYEHRQEEELQWTDGDYCLLQPLSDDEDVMKMEDNLKVICSSLHSGQEVRLFQLLLTLKVKYSALQAGNGVVSSFYTGSFSGPAQLYTCLLDLNDPVGSDAGRPKILFCCLSNRSEGLELFRQELDLYAGKIRGALMKIDNIESIPSDSEALQLIKSWKRTINYLSDILSNYHEYLSILIHVALTSSVTVMGSNATAVTELQTFIDLCSVNILMPNKSDQLIDLDETDKDMAHVTVLIDDSHKLSISIQESSEFSTKWAKLMLSNGILNVDPFFIKKVIHANQLKIIQDINVLKRYITDAVTNYYALYRCYSFIKSTGNVDVLLKYSLSEARSQNETDVIAVLSCLQEYINRKKPHPQPTPTPPTPLISF